MMITSMTNDNKGFPLLSQSSSSILIPFINRTNITISTAKINIRHIIIPFIALSFLPSFAFAFIAPFSTSITTIKINTAHRFLPLRRNTFDSSSSSYSSYSSSSPLSISSSFSSFLPNKNILTLSSSSSSDNDDIPSSSSDDIPSSSNDENEDGSIDIGEDPRLYRIRIPRSPGIEWGTDLSFAFVSVRAIEPGGPADCSCMIDVGDQLCELRPVVVQKDDDDIPGVGSVVQPVSLIGSPFDTVMNAFASLDRKVVDLDLVFFRGTKADLIELCTRGDDDDDASGSSSNNTKKEDDDGLVTITVIENSGTSTETKSKIRVEPGSNLRQSLSDNGYDVYQSITRFTNCRGKQLCGTCIVDLTEGAGGTNRKSMDECSTLRENPGGYRLSCVTFVYGDVTVETKPPVKASQWTR